MQLIRRNSDSRCARHNYHLNSPRGGSGGSRPCSSNPPCPPSPLCVPACLRRRSPPPCMLPPLPPPLLSPPSPWPPPPTSPPMPPLFPPPPSTPATTLAAATGAAATSAATCTIFESFVMFLFVWLGAAATPVTAAHRRVHAHACSDFKSRARGVSLYVQFAVPCACTRWSS